MEVDPGTDTAHHALQRTIRDEWGRVVAVLVRELRDLALAEDCAQEAAVAALEHWPRTGVPDRPGAWLLVAARRKAFDRLRRESRYAEKLETLQREAERTEQAQRRAQTEFGPASGGASLLEDDQLALLFGCCHPALALDAQVALTLRSLCGLTTAEVARAFLVPEPTMAQRLVRAKHKIRKAGVPFRIPAGDALLERVDAVLAVVYLVFNEGYSASAGDATIRHDLVDEALRLARLLARLRPEDAEVLGLLALLLLTDARRAARTDAHGELVALEDHDRSRWDRARIAEGLDVLAAAARLERTGPYQLQAAIAALHDRATQSRTTNWAAIVLLYGALYELQPSPVVALNQAVARGLGGDVHGALAALDQLSPELDGHHLLHAARADLLRRSGRRAEASPAYRRAIELAPTRAEQRFLQRRLAHLVAEPFAATDHQPR